MPKSSDGQAGRYRTLVDEAVSGSIAREFSRDLKGALDLLGADGFGSYLESQGIAVDAEIVSGYRDIITAEAEKRKQEISERKGKVKGYRELIEEEENTIAALEGQAEEIRNGTYRIKEPVSEPAKAPRKSARTDAKEEGPTRDFDRRIYADFNEEKDRLLEEAGLDSLSSARRKALVDAGLIASNGARGTSNITIYKKENKELIVHALEYGGLLIDEVATLCGADEVDVLDTLEEKGLDTKSVELEDDSTIQVVTISNLPIVMQKYQTG